jgi:hypothetical protein
MNEEGSETMGPTPPRTLPLGAGADGVHVTGETEGQSGHRARTIIEVAEHVRPSSDSTRRRRWSSAWITSRVGSGRG